MAETSIAARSRAKPANGAVGPDPHAVEQRRPPVPTPSSQRAAEVARVAQDLDQAMTLLLGCQRQLKRLAECSNATGRPPADPPKLAERPAPADQKSGRPGKIVPTEEQLAILSRIGDKRIKVVALSGTGKSTTLRLVAEHLKSKRGLYLAYNKSIAVEAGRTFPNSVTCKTAHGLAFQMQGLGRYRSKVVGKIYPDQIAGLVTLPKGGLGQPDGVLLGEVIGAIGAFCQSADPEITTAHSSLADISAARWVAETASKVWAHMIELDNSSVPMTHDGYLKRWQLAGGGHNLKFDYLMVDEAQDLNPVMDDAIRKFRGRVIYVGDPWQQIYGFRGAINALDHVDAPSLYLSQSWRFGAAVADVANTILSYALAPPEHPVRGNPAVKTEVATKGDYGTLISRTNATLFEAAATRQCSIHIIGGFNEVADLALSAHALQGNDLHGVKHRALRRFKSWTDLITCNETTADPELTRVIKLIDRYGSQVPAMVKSVQDRLCRENEAELVLGTGHRVKGREFLTVGVAEDFAHPEDIIAERKHDPIPQLEEELHLLYVSVTRAKRRLVLPAMFYNLYRQGHSGGSTQEISS